MTTIEELLRNTLTSLKDQHAVAGGPLNRAVAEVARAVETLSGGSLRLKLRLVRSVAKFSIYDLILTYRGDDSQAIAQYEVPLSVYPIKMTEIPQIEPNGSSCVINSEADLTEHFRRMVSDPESPLVYYLSYATRQFEEDKREAEQATAG